MFGSVILDVVIGMIFIYLLFSLVCSAVNEIIEAYMNKRAEFLYQGIKDLLGDADGKGWTKKLYEHPLISSLIQNKNNGKASMPSYIPARNFALALMDMISPAETGKPSGSADATKPKNAATTTDETTAAMENLRASAAEIKNKDVKEALLPLIDAAGSDVVKVRENIENWFNSAMDRVSGWYKRRTHIVILCIGFFIAVFLNVDSIEIANRLWHDKPLRDSLVAAAEDSVKNPPAQPSPAPTPQAATDDFKKDCIKNINKKGLCSESCLANVNSPDCKLDVNLNRIEDLGVPIGWKGNPLLSLEKVDFAWFWSWLMKLFGLVITAFAITLGAPFWFDLLNRFMVVRSTVKPREKSREEDSKE
jgi:hypothetical protein